MRPFTPNAPVYAQPFHEIIKASGEILSAPGDEVIVTANADGAVSFADNNFTVGSLISNGQALFVLSGSSNVVDNTESRYKEAKVNYEKAKLDYERASALIKEKIVSEKDFLATKAAYENAEITYNTLAKNYSPRGQRINAPLRGYLKNVLVSEGQYVTAGQPWTVCNGWSAISNHIAKSKTKIKGRSIATVLLKTCFREVSQF